MPQPDTAKNILLLGASGFVGKTLLQGLLQYSNYTVMALQNRQQIGLLHERLFIHQSSLGNLKLAELPFVPDVILHAARNRTGRFGKMGRRFMAWKGKRENERLLRQIKALENKPKIVYFSGSLMYGSHPGKLIDETFPTAPVSFAREYVAAEEPFLNELQDPHSNLLMIRLPWVIGNGSWFKWNYLDYMQQLQAVPLYGEGNNAMTFVHVNAIAPAIIHLLKGDFKGLLNLFHPQYVTQQRWAEMLSEVSGLPVRKLPKAAMAKLPAAVAEAFETEIKLGSVYTELQVVLQQEMLPLAHIVQKLLLLQHK